MTLPFDCDDVTVVQNGVDITYVVQSGADVVEILQVGTEVVEVAGPQGPPGPSGSGVAYDWVAAANGQHLFALPSGVVAITRAYWNGIAQPLGSFSILSGSLIVAPDWQTITGDIVSADLVF